MPSLNREKLSTLFGAEGIHFRDLDPLIFFGQKTYPEVKLSGGIVVHLPLPASGGRRVRGLGLPPLAHRARRVGFPGGGRGVAGAADAANAAFDVLVSLRAAKAVKSRGVRHLAGGRGARKGILGKKRRNAIMRLYFKR